MFPSLSSRAKLSSELKQLIEQENIFDMKNILSIILFINIKIIYM